MTNSTGMLHRSSECWWRQYRGQCIRWRAYTIAVQRSGAKLGPADRIPEPAKSALRSGPRRPRKVRGFREWLAELIKPEGFGL